MQHLLTFTILLFVFHSKSTSLYLLQNVVGAECSRCRISSLQNVMSKCKLMRLWWVSENQWSLCVNDESVMNQWWVGDESVMNPWWVGDDLVKINNESVKIGDASMISRWLVGDQWKSLIIVCQWWVGDELLNIDDHDASMMSRWWIGNESGN